MIFPNFLKRAGDMARSEPSDQIAINDRDDEATWLREKHPIAREILITCIFNLNSYLI